MIITEAPRIRNHKDLKSLASVVSYTGSKRWFVPEINKLWLQNNNSNRTLLELFCGGSSVSFGLTPDRAVLSDANPHIIMLLRAVKEGIRFINKPENSLESYLNLRDRFNQSIKDEILNWESAENYYWLLRMAFNHITRFNQQSLFNTPYNHSKVLSDCPDFSLHKKAMENWEILHVNDFEETPIDDNTFVYADCPYYLQFNSYTGNKFTWNDQERLAKLLSNHPGPVVATNNNTDLVTELYADLGFTIKTASVMQKIAANAEKRNVRIEMVAYKNL